MKKGRVVFGAMDEVVFGRPASEAIVEQLDRLGAQRAFLMVSGTLNRETDEIENIRRALGPRCAGTFDAMPPHTPRAAVIAAAEQARAAGCRPDRHHRRRLDHRRRQGGAALPRQRYPRPPTTSTGSGPVAALRRSSRRRRCARSACRPRLPAASFRATAGVTNEKTKVKEALRHPLMMPRAVILDPWLSLHTPEWLWLSTGIRAVDHCVEGICSREAHPYGDAQALKGLSMLAQALPRVKADADDLDARMDCQIGTWLSTGPLASGVPMGASHGIGYVLGAEFGVPHGHTSCVMLPSVMRWNKSANAERQALVAAAMGHPNEDAGDVLDAFIRSLGMPRSLREVKVTPEHFDRIAQAAMATPWVPRNPRKIEGPAQVREILDMAA